MCIADWNALVPSWKYHMSLYRPAEMVCKEPGNRGGAEAMCTRLDRLSHCPAGILTSYPSPLPLRTPFKGQECCLWKTHLLCPPSAESTGRQKAALRNALHQYTCRCRHTLWGLSPLSSLWHLLCPCRLSPSFVLCFHLWICLGTPWGPLHSLPPSPRRCGASACLGLRVLGCEALSLLPRRACALERGSLAQACVACAPWPHWRQTALSAGAVAWDFCAAFHVYSSSSYISN